MNHRMRRSKEKEPTFQALGAGDDAIFLTLKDVFMVAACVGFATDQREPLNGFGGEFLPAVFSPDDEAIVNAIAVAETGGIEILHPDREEEKCRIAEEYANGGIDLLKAKLDQAPGEPIDQLITVLAAEEEGPYTDVASQ